jgi:hypothetical protein
MWLAAREQLGNSGHQPLSSYDMGCLGLSGCVTSKGWSTIANPGSSHLRLKYFSMTSCSSKVLSFKGAQCRDEISTLIEEIGEFKLALRAMRAAMSFVHPWNKSVEAISSFFEQTEYCQSDTAHLDRRAGMLTSFCDYVLEENSNRWRAKEGFISTGEMKECWTAFLSTRPQAMLATVSRPLAQPRQPARPHNTNRHQPPANSHQHQAQAFSLPNPYFDNI